MILTRRATLAGLAAATFAPRARASANDTLTLREGVAQIAPSGYPETAIWGAEGMAPGPVLRFPQGARLTRTVVNELSQPTAIHWHGIRIDNAMDGVPGVTQDPIQPGEAFHYDFALPDAGTYWYHSHAQAVEQVERGIQGALIVEEATAPDVDAEHVLILDDWRLGQDAQIVPDFDNGHDLSHAGRIGNVVTTNGTMDLALKARRGDRLRLRLINSANARIFALSLDGMTGWLVATDGMPLAEPRVVNGQFALGPAQRLDLIVDIDGAGDTANLVDHVGGEAFSQVRFDLAGTGMARTTPPAALPPNPDHGPLSMEGARQIELRLEGGAMAWLPRATHMGVTRDGRELAAEGLFWALSGVAGRPDTPLAELARGETVRIDYVNDSRFPHAMHLHGHHFREIAADGSLGDMRDTSLVMPGQTLRTAFLAHNPGDWLLHCHMLGHHAAGMGTWIRVS